MMIKMDKLIMLTIKCKNSRSIIKNFSQIFIINKNFMFIIIILINFTIYDLLILILLIILYQYYLDIPFLVFYYIIPINLLQT